MIEFDHTLRMVLLGSTIIGAVGGVVGSYAVLRRQTLVGDVVSHATILGVVLAFLASFAITGTGSKSLYWLVPGALIAGLGAALLAKFLTEQTHVRPDSGLGVMLAIFFATGIAVLRWVQKAPQIPGKRGLENYLFGMAATMTQDDVILISVLAMVIFLVIALCWKELKLLTFDPVFAQSLGFRLQILEFTFLALLIVGIVIGIQCIGVILMVAMLVLPVTAAIHWTQRLGPLVITSGLLGGFNGMLGCLISASMKGLPTGPIVILVGIATLLLSILLGTQQGLWVSLWLKPNSPNESDIAQHETEVR